MGRPRSATGRTGETFQGSTAQKRGKTRPSCEGRALETATALVKRHQRKRGAHLKAELRGWGGLGVQTGGQEKMTRAAQRRREEKPTKLRRSCTRNSNSTGQTTPNKAGGTPESRVERVARRYMSSRGKREGAQTVPIFLTVRRPFRIQESTCACLRPP